jgi:predicted protein tyrosine phosphatase
VEAYLLLKIVTSVFSVKFIFMIKLYTSMGKVLFICNQNQNRSKTAEVIFQNKFQTKSAGLYNKNPVNKKQLAWADTVIVMENQQRSEIAKRFPKEYIQKRILSLEIPDVYNYNDSNLIKELKNKIKDFSGLI